VNAPSDEQLLADYLNGNEASFELLVRRYARELYQFAMRFTGNAVSAEDVVQETLLQLHTSAASFDRERRFKPWLFTIVANKARDHLRRRQRKRELAIDAFVDQESSAGQRFVELFSSDTTPPDDDLLIDERRRIVRETVESLPERLREVLILAYYHRFSYNDIAEVIGIPLGTVKSRLHAAVAQFAEAYEAGVKKQLEQHPPS